MIPTIEEIELAIMNYRDFNFRQNLIVFRVTNMSTIVNHECDCLIMSKSGYLTEIEIKRSYSDFMADFKKSHNHEDRNIGDFYFMVHESFYDKAVSTLIEKKHFPTGVYVYDDNCNITLRMTNDKLYEILNKNNPDFWMNDGIIVRRYKHGRKLFLEEQFQLARLGAMRYRNMTEKLIKLINK